MDDLDLFYMFAVEAGKNAVNAYKKDRKIARDRNRLAMIKKKKRRARDKMIKQEQLADMRKQIRSERKKLAEDNREVHKGAKGRERDERRAAKRAERVERKENDWKLTRAAIAKKKEARAERREAKRAERAERRADRIAKRDERRAARITEGGLGSKIAKGIKSASSERLKKVDNSIKNSSRRLIGKLKSSVGRVSKSLTRS